MKPALRRNRLFRFCMLVFSVLNTAYLHGQHNKITLASPIGGVVGGYLEQLPDDYTSNPTKNYPVLLYFHGISETGTGSSVDLDKLAKAFGPPSQTKDGSFPRSFLVNGQTFKYIVICPQFNRRLPVITPQELQQFINYIKQNYRVDPARMYMTGCSVNGGLIWNYCGESTANSASVAAVAIMAGSSVPNITRCNNMASQNLPVWAFHNTGDPSVPSSYTIGYTDTINMYVPAPNPLAKRTLINSNSHSVWYTGYSLNYKEDGVNVYQWLLRYSRNSNQPPNQLPTANAGADKTIVLPVSNTTLNGTASSDIDGTLTAYNWSQSSGPVSAVIANPNAMSTNITGLNSAGTYVFRLTVTDNDGGTSADFVSVIVQPANNIPPVANAGSDKTITLPGTNTTLDASGSRDDDGSIASYAWTQLSGPRTAVIVSPGAISTVVNTLTWPGDYVFQVKVTDNAGASATDEVKVTVLEAPNHPPVANAGADKTISLPVTSSSLSGSGSSDTDGTIAQYAWTQVSGPVTAVISSAATANTNISGLTSIGTYVFQLTVTDDDNASASDQATITVQPANNIPPVADAGVDKTITLPTSTSSVDAAASTDNDGTITSYTWTQLSGPKSASLASPNAVSTNVNSLTQAGDYLFQVRVTDNNGASALDEVKITVLPAANQPPSANAGADKSITLPTTTTSLSGLGTDPEGATLSYLWTQTSGPATASIGSPASANTSLTALTASGNYTFRLRVTDPGGLQATDDVVVQVLAGSGNQLPVANAGRDTTIYQPASSLVLNGTESYDPNGRITGYNWSRFSSPVTVKMTDIWKSTPLIENMSALGDYVFVLRVTDNNAATAYDTIKVTVAAPGGINQPPVANAGADAAITLPISSVTLSALNSFDPDGTIDTYLWNQVSGPVNGVISSPDARSSFVNGLTSPGLYTFEVEVKDNNGATARDQVVITVLNSSGNIPPVADAGPDITITLPQSMVTLDGSGSRDPDGTMKGYNWSKSSGPTVKMVDTWKSITRIENIVTAGTYVFVLKVTDAKGETTADTMRLIVKPITRLAANFTLPLLFADTLTSTGSIVEARIYPNPAKEKVYIKINSSDKGDGRVQVFNMEGRVMITQRFSKITREHIVQLPISNLSMGSYYIKVYIEGKTVIRQIFKL